MCGRYTLTKKQIRFASRFSTEELLIFLKERYNIAPTQTVPIIHIFAGKLVTEEIRWGLQPAWSKAPIINAQCEGILKKPTFRQSVLQRRCLMPADGFYEWQGKTPFLFTFPDREQFYFAGIVDTWTENPSSGRARLPPSLSNPALSSAGSASTNPTLCCTIITTAANEVISPFHKRMPFILAPTDYDAWLDPATKPDQLESIFQRPNAAHLKAAPNKPLVPDGSPPPPPKPTQGEFLLS